MTALECSSKMNLSGFDLRIWIGLDLSLWVGFGLGIDLKQVWI